MGCHANDGWRRMMGENGKKSRNHKSYIISAKFWKFSACIYSCFTWIYALSEKIPISCIKYIWFQHLPPLFVVMLAVAQFQCQINIYSEDTKHETLKSINIFSNLLSYQISYILYKYKYINQTAALSTFQFKITVTKNSPFQD